MGSTVPVISVETPPVILLDLPGVDVMHISVKEPSRPVTVIVVPMLPEVCVIVATGLSGMVCWLEVVVSEAVGTTTTSVERPSGPVLVTVVLKLPEISVLVGRIIAVLPTELPTLELAGGLRLLGKLEA